jgi:hypothetical protein
MDSITRLNDFKQLLLQERVVTRFTSPDNLAASVAVSLRRWEEKNRSSSNTTGGNTYHQSLHVQGGQITADSIHFGSNGDETR